MENIVDTKDIYEEEDPWNYLRTDISYVISSPADLFHKICFNSNHFKSNLAMRFYNNIIIGEPHFPPLCKKIIRNDPHVSLEIDVLDTAITVWNYNDTNKDFEKLYDIDIYSGRTEDILSSYTGNTVSIVFP